MVRIVKTDSIYVLSDIDNKLIMSIVGYCEKVDQYFDGFVKCWLINYKAFIYNSKSNELIITHLTSGFRKQKDTKIFKLKVISLKHALYESVVSSHEELVEKGYTRLSVLLNNTIIAEFDLI